MSTGPESFRIRSLSSSVYLPNLLFAIGQGATIPVVALLALELGASPAVAGVIVALRGLGTMLFDLPAGVLVARLGEKRSMVVSGVALALVSVAVWQQPSLLLYAVLTTVMGCTWAVWLLARIAFAAGSSPNRYRGRVMAMIGGVHRIGLLVGPLLGSLVISRGSLSDPFLVLAVLSLAAALAISAAGEPRVHTGARRGLSRLRVDMGCRQGEPACPAHGRLGGGHRASRAQLERSPHPPMG